ncbi:MAG: beta-ketoacyl-[acyl-carrier-protein] synthase II, partial [Candidatus Omnitrophota bacterium]
SGSTPGQEIVNCPFDKRRNGILLSEGACLLAMEELEHAKKRDANILGEVIGFGTRFDPFRINRYNPRATGLIAAMRLALEDAEITVNDIDYICANANSTPSADKVETFAIKEVFGKRAHKIPVSAVKSMVGEGFSVSGAFAAAASLAVLKEGFIFPTINYRDKDPDCDLDYVPNKSRLADVKNILLITTAPSGGNTCMVLRKYKK